jgi:feruloyl-CoA synthase
VTVDRSIAPFRPLALGPYDAEALRRDDGSWLLRSTEALALYPRAYTQMLARWAREAPNRCFMAKRRSGGDWQGLSYAQAFDAARAIGAALLARGLGPERPVMILSGNDLEHALLLLGALHVGIACAPVSPAYSLLAPDAERVRHAVELLTPGLVFAADAGPFQRAIEQAVPPGTELVFTHGTLPGRASTAFAELLATAPTPAMAAAVDEAHAAIDGDTVAKFLFTSGSTKLPKAVITTHRMLCCNPVMNGQAYPFVQDEPPILVDWLPWHHVAGGSADVGLVLCHGGTLYIDDGRPTQEGIVETVRNLREVAPTMYYTVPKGLEMLTQAMAGDAALRDNFFSRLRLIFPAGAALPPPLKAAVDRLSVQSCGWRVPMTMGLGMTETAPFAITAHLPDWQPGVIGIPAAGVTLKLAPVGDKLEVRYRGPNITPGYWRQPAMTAEAFDEEGFFCSGDGVRFIDDARQQQGLKFDGRIAEDFKLATGTWVNVGGLRAGVIGAGSPYIHDVVITGHDRMQLGMLVFLLPAAAQLSATLPADASPAQMAADPAVRAWLQGLLDRLAKAATGSSQRIDRALLQAEPASLGSGEMTDKGSINQRAVLKRRADLVERLYADAASAESPSDPEVLRAA